MKNNTRYNTKYISKVAIVTALYLALSYAFHPISFLQVQVRISNALIPLIAIFEGPAFIGLILGHALFNISSPLGWLDLVSVILFIPAKWLILRKKLYAVPLHILSVAVWVGILLYNVGLPLVPSIISVGVGEFIAEILLGVPLYVGIYKRYQKIDNVHF